MEKLIEKLKTLNYKYKIVSENKFILILDFNQIIIIELNNNKLIINNGFKGWNFLIGRLNKDLNFALKYISFLAIFATIHIFIFHNINGLGFYIIITIYIILSLLWYFNFYIKFLFIKKIVIDLWLNS